MLKQVARKVSGTNELDQALFTATHFGFFPIKAPKLIPQDLELVKHCPNLPHYDAAEKVSFIRTYLEENLASISYPLAVVYKKPITRRKYGSYGLHVVGSSAGVAEATLIRATLSILSEEGYKNLRVDLNCIGDRESVNTYERELAGFVRKFGAELPEEAKIDLKNDVFNLFRLDTPEIVELRANAPSAITYLSPASRLYFKEVLEYIDALGIEFRLTPDLVGEKNHSSHAIFAIKDTAEESSPLLAVGYSYSRLGRLCGLRKDTPLSGVSIFSPLEKDESSEERSYRDMPKPKFCLLQLGRDARIKTLTLLEVLRTHRISVHHFLSKDKITVQLATAETLPVSHLIIIGQKEALDNTATIRNVTTRAQDTVSLSELPRYLKHIRL